MRVIDIFERSAVVNADRACFRFAARTITYAEVRDLAWRIADGLAAEGFRPGDKCGVYSINHPDAFIAVLGLLRAGLVWLPINPRGSVADNAAALADFDCDVLFFHSEFELDISQIRAAAPRIRRCIRLDGDGADDLRAWSARFSTKPAPLDDDEQSLVSITATGGTTGRPKGVMLTQANVVAFTEGHIASRGYRSYPVYLAAAPMTHVAGRICFPVIKLGGTIVVVPGANPETILRAVATEKVTMLFLPPTAIYTLMNSPQLGEHDLSSLELFMYGGSAMSTAQIRRALQTFGPIMSQGYGQTEAPMLLATLRPEDHFVNGAIASDERLSSCGKPTAFVQVEIMNDDGAILPRGATGEIVVRGSMVMKGYYKNPEATAEARRFGWHHTGDIGRFDDEGFLHIVDRKKDMIVTGGFNVFSSEVEQVIASIPGVEDVAVIGVPDEKWGEAVKAVVKPMPGTALSESQLIAAVRPLLGGVKTPKSVEFWPDLPRNPAGKVLKRAIRDRFWASRERKV